MFGIFQPPCDYECVPKRSKWKSPCCKTKEEKEELKREESERKKEEEERLKVKEFVGTVRINFTEAPKWLYNRNIWKTSWVVFADLLLGFCVLTVFFYATSDRIISKPFYVGSHIVLCTIGLQFCQVIGILNANAMHGVGAVMNMNDRNKAHIIFLLFGFICVLAGSIMVLVSTFALTVHYFASVVALGVYVMGMVTGPAALLDKQGKCGKCLKASHFTFGILSMIASTLCFVTGLFKKSFINWSPTFEMAYVTMAFSVFYTIIVLYIIFSHKLGL